MKKIFLILVCFLTAFVLSCGGDDPEAGGGSCTSNFDCPIGKICSDGTCVAENSGDNGSGDNGNGDGELPDGGSNDGGSNNGGDSTDTANPDDTDSNSSDTDTDTGSSDTDTDTGSSDTDSSDKPDTSDSADDSDPSDSGSEGDTETDDGDTGFDPGCIDSCVPLEPGCLPAMESEKAEGLCNGVDDDCDGKIDEGCPCKAGETQPCFSGAPNFRRVGTCADGVQTCIVVMRAGQGDWGKSQCVGEIKPSTDVCDNADNACNGCADHNLCCAPPIDCAFDLTEGGTKPFKPFTYRIIDGKQIYRKFNDADTATWEWTLTKGPCDIVLNKVNSFVKGGKTLEEVGDINTDNGVQDTMVSGVGLSQFKVKFRLSGNYKLHLKVTRPNGEVYECEWVIRVESDGLRIELCWDTTGSHDTGGRDLDLHMGKEGTTKDSSSLFGLITTSGWDTTTACYYSSMTPNWGYSTTENYDKNGVWQTSMNNPRLDMDNIRTAGEPENINVDNPKSGDTFKVLVRMYPWDDYSGSAETHPVVNVYCGGTLKATYGTAESGTQLSGFKNDNDSWKVVEVKWVGDYSSDACELTPNLSVNSASVPYYDNW